MLAYQLEPLRGKESKRRRQRPGVAVCGAEASSLGFARAAIVDKESLLLYFCESRGHLRSLVKEALPQLDGPRGPGFRRRVLHALMSPALGDGSVGGLIIVNDADVRADLIGAALRAGKHVLAEPPVALTRASAVKLYETAAQHGRSLLTSSSARESPRISRIANVARQFAKEGRAFDNLSIRRNDPEMRAALRSDGLSVGITTTVIAAVVADLLLCETLLGPLQVVRFAHAENAQITFVASDGRGACLSYGGPALPIRSSAVSIERRSDRQILWNEAEAPTTAREDISLGVAAPLSPGLQADWTRFRKLLSRGDVSGRQPAQGEPEEESEDEPENEPGLPARELALIDLVETVLGYLGDAARIADVGYVGRLGKAGSM